MIRIPESEAREKSTQMIERDGQDLVTISPADQGNGRGSIPPGGADDEPTWKKIVRIGEEIPIEDRQKIPTDLSKNSTTISTVRARLNGTVDQRAIYIKMAPMICIPI